MKVKLKSFIGASILIGVIGAVSVQSWIEMVGTELRYVVSFPRGIALTAQAEKALTEAARELLDNSDLVVRIEAHTGTRGDGQANLELSEQRATLVRDQLVQLGVAPERIEMDAFGGDRPLQRGSQETDRAYQLRLSRAEIIIGYAE